jgi:hypothetical protein
MSKPGSIGLVTIFLPRMELDHLGEWIEYHQRIGVSRIFLYNNGHLSVDGSSRIFVAHSCSGSGMRLRCPQKKRILVR